MVNRLVTRGATGAFAALPVECALAVTVAVVTATVVAENDVFGAWTRAGVCCVHTAQEVATRRARIEITLQQTNIL